MKKFILCVVSLFIVLGISCTDADVASSNLRQAAEQFQLTRRIVFFNGITDKYLLSIVGRCSIEVQRGEKQLEVTCKTGEGTFKKHHLGLSDNVSYFSEQLTPKNVSVYHYRVIFKPSAIVPNIDFK